MTAPVAYFIYDRPDHVRETLTALARNVGASETDVHVFADGPRPGADPAPVLEARTIAATMPGFRSITMHERETNLGLVGNVPPGIGQVAREHGRVIVVEDDIKTTPHFLEYMNSALDLYEHHERVFSVGGYCYPGTIPTEFPDDVFLYSRFVAWGWATWADRWDQTSLDVDMDGLLRDPQWREQLATGGHDLLPMAWAQDQGLISTYDVQIALLMAKRRMYSVQPIMSMVRNIGNDGSGTHTGVTDRWDVPLDDAFSPVLPARPRLDRTVIDVMNSNFMPTQRSATLNMLGDALLLVDSLISSLPTRTQPRAEAPVPPPRVEARPPQPSPPRGSSSEPDDFVCTTPVALVIFNRPDTTADVFSAIARAAPPKLFVIGDGAPNDAAAAKVEAARSIVERVNWPCEVFTNFSDVNLGCVDRIFSGLDWVFDQVDEAIVLEDDCVPDPTFFRYCQDLLEKYRDDERVSLICGTNHLGELPETADSYYFSKYSHMWGWASWRRSWQNFDRSDELWKRANDSDLLERVHRPEEAAWWRDELARRYSGELENSWDYQFILNMWERRQSAIVPTRNLIQNIGFRPDATLTTDANSPLANRPTYPVPNPLAHPAGFESHPVADELFARAMLGITAP